jgi:SAM-dependent methyltransferase
VAGTSDIFQGPLVKRNGLFDSEPKIRHLPLALKINLWSPVARFYENPWRRRSIGILTLGKFSTRMELKLMVRLLGLRSGQRVLDAGCSAGLYSRRILTANAGVEVHAVDLSLPFLQAAKQAGTAPGHLIILTRADLENLPYRNETFDAIVCDGTPNEWRNASAILGEFSRILKANRSLSIMYLSKTKSLIGKLLQALPSLGGIHFFDHGELNRIAKEFNLRPVVTKQRGVVNMTLYRPEMR